MRASRRRDFATRRNGAEARLVQLTEGRAALAQRAMAARGDSTELLASINVPTLVIGGVQDAIIPAMEVRAMTGLIPGARLVELDTGHLSNLEAPRAFNDALGSLLVTAGAAR